MNLNLPWIKFSWQSCSMWDKLEWLNWFWQFLFKGLSLIRKDFITHIHGLAVYVKDGLPFVRDLSFRKLCEFLLSQMALLRWLTFLLGSLTVTLTVLLFWIYFFLFTQVFVLPWLFSIGKFWSYFCLSFHWLSVKLKTGCPVLSHTLWLFSCWWDGLRHLLRDVPWEDIFKDILKDILFFKSKQKYLSN